jgi:leucyl aminopeptidase
MQKSSDAIQKLTASFFSRNKFGSGAEKAGATAVVYFDGSDNSQTLIKKLKSKVPAWQLESFEASTAPLHVFASKNGPIWVLRPHFFDLENSISGHYDKLKPSAYGKARDLVGQWFRQTKDWPKEPVLFEFLNSDEDQILGAWVGLGLAQYKYTDTLAKTSKKQPVFHFSKGSADLADEADALISSINISRHLTNMPGGDLNPKTFSEIAKVVFRNKKSVKLDIWEDADVKKEGMGLLHGVGAGGEHGARLIHIRYRPPGSKGLKPRAFVGKGITFDTGGLDIKPASGMRWMKKDMSGAGTVFALAHYVTERKLAVPCDFYLAIAENCVSAKATRPGDVHIARNGKSVEIHNTDAEGRLALADALDVAVTQKGKDEPAEVIDVSTLTGAMRVSLGLDVAGYFSNSDDLADELERASREAGELAWRMPLVKKYKNQLSSNFADYANCSDSGFGGAISAALFLEYFVREKPWAHFDVMSWNNSPSGAVSEGGNAQSLQILARYLENLG